MVKPNGVPALSLDPGDYGGTYKLIGGRVSLDFVNTVSYPGTDHPHDWLDRPANVLAWALAVDLIDQTTARSLARRTAAHPRSTAHALERIRQRRATITAALSPLARGKLPARDDVDALNQLLIAARGQHVIDPATLEWCWEPPQRLDDIVRPVILDTADVLTSGDHSRIHHCPACQWLFYDGTRNRSRRWCAMADCGSRDKALRYYHRHRRQRHAGE